MTTPQLVSSLRRPSVFGARSSSSSLVGSDQSIASFRNFVKQTPPILDSQKPLPPPPLDSRRASSSTPPRSRSSTPSQRGARRSSSVYSRTISQWDSDNISWRSTDFADEPLPPMPVLHPLAYSASTPHLVGRSPTPPPLLPRVYKPLTATPSSATSQSTTYPSPLDDRSTYFPEHNSQARRQYKHVRTVSLEEAIAAVHGPGAVHLLPEELRAKIFRRSRSDEALRLGAGNPFSPIATLESPEPPTLVDVQGRRRTIISPKGALTHASAYHFPDVGYGNSAHTAVELAGGPVRYMVPLATQHRAASKDKVVQALGLDEFDEPRGRTRHRGPRRRDYTHYLPNGKWTWRTSSPESEPEAQKIAREYHALLHEQYRKPSKLSAYDYNENLMADIRLVPRPLFRTKVPAELPGHLQRTDHVKTSSQNSLTSPGGSVCDSDRDIFELRLSPSSEYMHKRCSTSGSIPISPPQLENKALVSQFPKSTSTEFKKTAVHRPKAKDNRVSAYYPHVASRKGTKVRSNTKKRAKDSKFSPLPFPSDDVAQRSKKIESFATATLNTKNGAYSRKSDASSNRRHRPLQRRLAKYVDLLTKPELPDRDDYQPITAATISPGSPHLLPSPVTPKSKEVHLGWSEIAKRTFDRIVSPGTSPTKGPSKIDNSPFVHIVAPARPLDERKMTLTDPEPPRRKSSIFGGFLDSWKESKAEKRREELKKIIRFVPYDDENASRINR